MSSEGNRGAGADEAFRTLAVASHSARYPENKARIAPTTAASSTHGDGHGAQLSPFGSSKSKRKNTGCLTCRKRRIKCGEERPICQNCVRSKRSCEGYRRPLTFRDPTDIATQLGLRSSSKIEHPSAPIQPPVATADTHDARSGPQPSAATRWMFRGQALPRPSATSDAHFSISPITSPRPLRFEEELQVGNAKEDFASVLRSVSQERNDAARSGLSSQPGETAASESSPPQSATASWLMGYRQKFPDSGRSHSSLSPLNSPQPPPFDEEYDKGSPLSPPGEPPSINASFQERLSDRFGKDRRSSHVMSSAASTTKWWQYQVDLPAQIGHTVAQTKVGRPQEESTSVSDLPMMSLPVPKFTIAETKTDSSPAELASHRSSSESEISFVRGTDPAQVYSYGERKWNGTTRWAIISLAWNLVEQCSLAAKTLADKPNPSPNDPAVSSKKAAANTKPSGSSSSRKRSFQGRDNEDDPEDDENEDGQSPGAKRQRGGKEASSKLFACPYAKHNPQRYSEQNTEEKQYRGCASKYLNSIARVKQHLYRVHARPQWYCGNCYNVFKSREQLNNHSRQRPPCDACPPRFEEMMTDEQYKQVKRRAPGSSPSESWFAIYQILFPASGLPVSPYVSTSNPDTLRHFVNFFRTFGPQELQNILRECQERYNGGRIPLEASTQVVVDEAFEIALPTYLRRAHPPPDSLDDGEVDASESSRQVAQRIGTDSGTLEETELSRWPTGMSDEVVESALASLPAVDSDPDSFWERFGEPLAANEFETDYVHVEPRSLPLDPVEVDAAFGIYTAPGSLQYWDDWSATQ